MKKILLGIILVVDGLIIVGLLILLGERILFVPKEGEISSQTALEEKISDLPLKEETTTNTLLAGKETKKRNIQFKHWAPQAKKVEIVSDFNNWTPTLMTKEEDLHWMIDYQLEPGEYTYKFLVDGKLKKDPYNKRSVPDGYGGESSLLIVKLLGVR